MSKKKKKKEQVSNTPLELEKPYKILWIDESGLFVLVHDEVAKGTIVRYTNVSFGDVAESGNVPVSFTADILDNPQELQFESDDNNSDGDEYLGNLITTVVMDSMYEENGMISITGSDTDGENRNPDSE